MELIRQVIEADTSKRVASITVTLSCNDSTGTVNISDLMLQGGRIATEWSGHPSEEKWDNEG